MNSPVNQANDSAPSTDAHTLFYRDDLNLTSCDRSVLLLVCKHAVLVRTAFPKLATYLFGSQAFAQLLRQNATVDKNEDEQMTCIIESINSHINATTTVVASDDSALWDILRRRCLQSTPSVARAKSTPSSNPDPNVSLREKSPNPVMVTVADELKSNVYYNYSNYNDDSLSIRQSRRTRKNIERSTNESMDSKMRYGRSISIM